MKRFVPLSTLLAAILVFLSPGCEKKCDDPYRFQFQFITENYKPLNYVENGSLSGLAPDILKEVCESLNIPFEVKVLPWAEGYDQVQKSDNAVLFSTILNSTRKDLFKWAGPIASLDWLFYAAANSQITLNSLDDAKKIGRIGVLKDYAIEQYLVQEGFTNLIYCSDNIEAFDQ
ncbi:MAG: transporter substrate-binding domain-containing protein, partial [Bacteroidia bacterium]|nr:transporter substrate-binding domain-containing protein [Bacteroidia bacterium]